MEKITSNRDIIKISHIGNFTNEEINGMTRSKFSNENYERNDLFNDELNQNQIYDVMNMNQTPASNNLSQEDNSPMKEIKLFSRVDNQKCNKTYFSNKVIAQNLCNPGMPKISNNNFFGNLNNDEHNLSTHIKISEATNENCIPFGKINPGGIFNSRESDQDNSPESFNKRMKRMDLTSWGGFDYTNMQNTNFQNYDNKRSSGSVNRQGREYAGNYLHHNEGRIKQIFNDCAYDTEKYKETTEARCCKSRTENDNICINPTYNQSNYYSRVDDIQVKKKVMKSNSYSPTK